MNYENYDPFFPDQPVVDLYLPIWAKLPSFKSKPAFIWAEDGPEIQVSSITYEELNSSVQCISSELLLSLRKNDTVLVLCAPGLEFVEMIFGCQRAGLLAVPISPPHPSFSNDNWHHLLRVVSQTMPKVAIAQRDYIKHVEKYVAISSNKKLSDALRKIRWISTEDLKGKKMKMQTETVSFGGGFSYNGCNADDVYLIQYTSGATAIPKPVLVTAGSAAHNVRVARKAYDLHPNTVIVSWLPQYHDCGLMFLLLTIVSGATCVLTSPNTFVNRPRIWLELISEFKATCTPVPSFTLPLVLKRGHAGATTKTATVSPISMSSLKNLIIVNEPIHNDCVEEFVEVFRPFGLNPSAVSPSYGLAENGTFVSTSWRSSNLDRFPTYKKILPSARLDEDVLDVEVLVVNEETNDIVEDGVEGEIWISSPSNATGYLGHPSLTQRVFNARLKNNPRKCYVRTGDRGVVKGEQRFLYVTGRCSDIIKLPNGQEIHPHYLETSAYRSCPNFLRGGCVAAFEMSESEYTSIAVLAELQGKGEIENDTFLKQICEGIRKAIMKEEGVGIGIVVLVKVGNVPKTTSGKIQRWLAKYKFVKSKMNIIMQMKFDNNGNVQSTVQKVMQNGKKESIKEKKLLVVDEEEGIFFAPTNTTLKSSL